MEIPQRDAAVRWSAPAFQIPAPDLSIGKSYEKRPKNMPGEGFPKPGKKRRFLSNPAACEISYNMSSAASSGVSAKIKNGPACLVSRFFI